MVWQLYSSEGGEGGGGDRIHTALCGASHAYATPSCLDCPLWIERSRDECIYTWTFSCLAASLNADCVCA